MTGENLEGFDITKASELVGGTYLSVELVNKLNMIGTQKIKKVTVEIPNKDEEPPQKKLGLEFVGHEGMILILNKTNTRNMIQLGGDDFKSGDGMSVELSIIKVKYMGKLVDSTLLEAKK